MIPKRILIVDDEESFRHMLSVILIKEGYEVETSSNGEEGCGRRPHPPLIRFFVISVCPVWMVWISWRDKKDRDRGDDHRDVGLRNGGYCH